MKLREVLTLLGSATAWPLAARAQQFSTPVVGFLRSTSSASSEHILAAFRGGLTEFGFVEGRNVVIEQRWADGLMPSGALSKYSFEPIQCGP